MSQIMSPSALVCANMKGQKESKRRVRHVKVSRVERRLTIDCEEGSSDGNTVWHIVGKSVTNARHVSTENKCTEISILNEII